MSRISIYKRKATKDYSITIKNPVFTASDAWSATVCIDKEALIELKETLERMRL